MTYTDKDILDLETSLGTIGIETQVRYGILRPDGMDKGISFFHAICRHFQDDLQRTGISLKSSCMLREKRIQMMEELEGPTVATTALMEKITQKFNVEEVLQFP